MKYHIQILDSLIRNNGENSIEVDSVIESIKVCTFRLNTEEETRFVVKKYQIALTLLKKHNHIADDCDSILFFIESYFFNYTDDSLLISEYGKLNTINLIEPTLIDLRTTFKDGISASFYSTLSPILDIKNRQNLTIHISKYIYEIWGNWLYDHRSSNIYVDMEESLMCFLIAQNYNSTCFYNFITNKIISELFEEFDPYIQEQLMLIHQQKIQNIPISRGLVYNYKCSDIKSQLLEWFKVELKKCRKKQERYNPNQQTVFDTNSPKIETSLSVGQLAYFFKLLYESNIITNKIQVDILHVLSEKIKTKKQDTISFSSLHNKYYQVEDNTKSSIREVLQSMLSKILSCFFVYDYCL